MDPLSPIILSSSDSDEVDELEMYVPFNNRSSSVGRRQPSDPPENNTQNVTFHLNHDSETSRDVTVSSMEEESTNMMLVDTAGSQSTQQQSNTLRPPPRTPRARRHSNSINNNVLINPATTEPIIIPPANPSTTATTTNLPVESALLTPATSATECCICYTELTNHLCALMCGHVLHHNCARRLRVHEGARAACPLCRQPASTLIPLFLTRQAGKITEEADENGSQIVVVVNNVSAETRDYEQLLDNLQATSNNFEREAEDLRAELEEMEAEYDEEITELQAESTELRRQLETQRNAAAQERLELQSRASRLQSTVDNQARQIRVLQVNLTKNESALNLANIENQRLQGEQAALATRHATLEIDRLVSDLDALQATAFLDELVTLDDRLDLRNKVGALHVRMMQMKRRIEELRVEVRTERQLGERLQKQLNRIRRDGTESINKKNRTEVEEEADQGQGQGQVLGQGHSHSHQTALAPLEPFTLDENNTQTPSINLPTFLTGTAPNPFAKPTNHGNNNSSSTNTARPAAVSTAMALQRPKPTGTSVKFVSGTFRVGN